MTDISKVVEKYMKLKGLDPENDLLKYYGLDDGLLRLTKDTGKAIEFRERFGPNKEIMRECKSYDEYQKKLKTITFNNYINALEVVINFMKLDESKSIIN